MIIIYSFIGDRAIVSIPESVQWEIVSRSFDDKGDDDNGLYLVIDGKERCLSVADAWCSGRNIPEFEIGALHEDVVGLIFAKMTEDSSLRMIDIDRIISELLATKYEKRWAERGYIEMRADGSW